MSFSIGPRVTDSVEEVITNSLWSRFYSSPFSKSIYTDYSVIDSVIQYNQSHDKIPDLFMFSSLVKRISKIIWHNQMIKDL